MSRDILLGAFVICLCFTASGQPEVQRLNVHLNGEPQDDGIMWRGKAYAPIRVIAKAFGADVRWHSDLSLVEINGGKEGTRPIRSVEGVLSPEQAKRLSSRTGEWIAQVQTQFRMLKPDRWTVKPEIDAAIPRVKTEYLPELRTRYDQILRGLPMYSRMVTFAEFDPYGLVAQLGVSDALREGMDDIDWASDLLDDPYLERPFSTEFFHELVELKGKGAQIYIEVSPHVSALARWYDSQLKRPSW